MKTVILCGGQGTRLRERTESIPKPLVEIGARPILWHLMKIYMAQSFREFVLCLGYRGDSIKDYFLGLLDDKAGDFRLTTDGNGGIPRIEGLRTAAEAWDITFAETGLETDTGGRLHRVRPYVGGGTFFLTYADGLSDIDLAALLAFHKSHGRLATVTAVRPRSSLGLLDLNGDGQVVGFREKPLLDHVINGGYFVLEPGIFEYTTASCNFERDVLPRVAEDGQLMAYHHAGYWGCMDTYKDNVTLNELWKSKRAPWKIWDEGDHRPAPPALGAAMV